MVPNPQAVKQSLLEILLLSEKSCIVIIELYGLKAIFVVITLNLGLVLFFSSLLPVTHIQKYTEVGHQSMR